MPLLLCLSTIGAYVIINNKFLEIADLMTALEIFDSLYRGNTNESELTKIK